ncbi:MAG: nucleoside triphosphate pyrophosphohydrolase [Synergistaceae bacterium]|nr:nucleoside triphosphate pyrophosphohydrolase [Synergistaceae bacterium]
MNSRKEHFFDGLVSIIERLRGPGGCPWDREQRAADLRAYIVEEAYELTDAISKGDPSAIREESGDLLLQIVFLASIEKEAGELPCGVEDVVGTLCEKLIRRHPHVFGDALAADSEQVLRSWEKIKREEKGGREKEASVLSGVPRGLPPLLKAHRMQGKAAHVGFDWPKGDVAPLFAKLEEEVAELRAAAAKGDADAAEDELGDVLFMAVNLARYLKINPDAALSRACEKFASRFRHMEMEAAESGSKLEDLSPAELDGLWNEAKKSSSKQH